MIDVLRASTTITTALAHGAAGVWPVPTIDEAHAVAARLGAAAILGGERGGRRIAGFDLGNSPAEYTPQRVAGRPVVMTTTNGTAALAACAAAREILVGALVNRRAVANAALALARQGDLPVHLVCAGTDGAVSSEDVLAAGAILDAVTTETAVGSPAVTLDPAADAALESFRRCLGAAAVDPGPLEDALRSSPGGVNLVAIGMADDLARCSRLDTLAVVGHLDRRLGRLEPWVALPPAG